MQSLYDEVFSPDIRHALIAKTNEEVISSQSYKDAGVDIDAGNRLVKRIKSIAAATKRLGVTGDLGGFGGLFDIAATGYADPILVAATDGVGTKLTVAIAAKQHRTIGIDLVAMCVNDLVVQGAEPLFFLDYFATAALDVDIAHDIVAGIADGCRDAGCALLGGETAEMPGTYAPGDYDLAGFAVGAVERDRLITGAQIAAGDIVVGLAANGVHANGFSLVRRLVETAGLDYSAPAPFAPQQSLAAALLAPTRIYVRACLAALNSGGIKGYAHITGGGLLENIPRVLPENVAVRIDARSWDPDPVFRWLAAAGRMEAAEMYRTFNCGIGMAAIIDPGRVDEVIDAFETTGETAKTVGAVEERRPGTPQIIIDHAAMPWAA